MFERSLIEVSIIVEIVDVSDEEPDAVIPGVGRHLETLEHDER